ncbi:MAG: DMT family transporter [Acidobacteriota bacterium]
MKPQADIEREPLALRWRADAVLVAVTALWGADFVVVKHLLAAVDPIALLFWRFAVAAVLLAALLPWRRRTPGLLVDGLVLGLLLALGMGLQVVGQVETTASKAAFLTGLSAVLTPLAGYLRTRRLPTLENGLGILLAGTGFAFLTFPAGGGPVNRGDLYVFACGVVFAFYIVELAERSGRHDSVWLAWIQIAVVAVTAAVALGWAGAVGGPATIARLAASSPAFLIQVLFLAVVGTAATFTFQTWAQVHMSATHAAIIFTLEPVFTAAIARWVLAERLAARGWMGGILVLGGIVVSELRLRRASSPAG